MHSPRPPHLPPPFLSGYYSDNVSRLTPLASRWRHLYSVFVPLLLRHIPSPNSHRPALRFSKCSSTSRLHPSLPPTTPPLAFQTCRRARALAVHHGCATISLSGGFCVVKKRRWCSAHARVHARMCVVVVVVVCGGGWVGWFSG